MSFLKNKIWYFLLAFIAVTYCYMEADGHGDFYIFMSAAGDLSRSKNIFVTKYLEDYHYYYSVFFALLLKPFYLLPFFWVKFYWLLLNVWLFVKLFLLLANAPVTKALQTKQKSLFLILVFIFSFRFLHENIHTSQITILILWCCVYGLLYIHKNKPLLGSIILAMGISIKLLPIVLLPYLIYRGYFKAFAFTIACYAFTLFAPALIIDPGYNTTLLQSWFHLINPTNTHHVLDVDERSFHSLSTLLSTLLIENPPDLYAMPIKRNIANISLTALGNVLLAVRVALILFTFYFLKWSWFKKAASEKQRFIEIAYILLLIPLIFPHQQHYAFLFMVPAFAVVLFYFISDFSSATKLARWVFCVMLSLVYLCANMKVVLGEFNHYYEHFKILTYGALIMIPLLALVSGKNKLLFVSK